MNRRDYEAKANEALQKILDLLRMYEDVGSIFQRDYMNDFFKVFHQAYKDGFCGDQYRCKWDDKCDRYVRRNTAKPLICGDLIWQLAKEEGWVDADGGPSTKRYEDIQAVMVWWDAWTFAYDHNPPPRTYIHRRHSRA